MNLKECISCTLLLIRQMGIIDDDDLCLANNIISVLNVNQK